MKTILIALFALAACEPNAKKQQKEAERCGKICAKLNMVPVGLAFFVGEEHATCVCQPSGTNNEYKLEMDAEQCVQGCLSKQEICKAFNPDDDLKCQIEASACLKDCELGDGGK